MPATILLLALVLTAAATDLARRKIYNWTTYPGIIAALLLSAAGSALVALGWTGEQWLRQTLGWISISESLLGLVACGLIMLVCFVLFRVGGGDVKLIAMMGAFMGPEQGIEAMLWTFTFGGCVGLIVLIWRVGPWQLCARAIRHLFWSLRFGHWEPLTDDQRAQLQLPLFLAPWAVPAVVIVRFGLSSMLM